MLDLQVKAIIYFYFRCLHVIGKFRPCHDIWSSVSEWGRQVRLESSETRALQNGEARRTEGTRRRDRCVPCETE